MERKQLGATDLTVSAICYGGAHFGALCGGEDLDARINQFRNAGGNFLDTAHCYAFWLPQGAGCSEKAIGEYVRRNGKGDLVIATKGGCHGVAGYERPDQYLSARQIGADLDDSLRRLGQETVDLYWLHHDDTRMPVAEILGCLNDEAARGRIRYFGVSNWHHARLREACEYASTHGLRGFDASQQEWNLAWKRDTRAENPGPGTGKDMRVFTPADHDLHRKTGMPLVAYSAAAGGYFATNGEQSRQAYDTALSRARLSRAQELAEKKGVTPGQIALAWLISQDIPVFPIIGALDAGHLAEYLAAAEVSLSRDEEQWLACDQDPRGGNG